MNDGILWFAGDWIFRSLILFSLTSLVLYGFRSRFSAARRFDIWLVTFVVIALLPAMMIFVPGIRKVTASEIQPAAPMVTVDVADSGHDIGTGDINETDPSMAINLSLEQVVVSVWIIGASLLAIRFLINFSVLGRFRRKPFYRHALVHLLPERVHLVASKRSSPMAFGLIRPCIVLPQESHHWSDEKSEYVIRHELAHLNRKDPLWIMLSAILMIPCWINPLQWIILRKLNESRENATDDCVLSNAKVKPSQYASYLTELSIATNKPFLVATMAAATPHDLEKRVETILNADLARSLSSKKLLLAGLLFTFTSAFTLCLIANNGEPEDGIADGFDYPVGKNGNADGYYIYRGFTEGDHPGEDWNGKGGGNTDLGDPVYSIGHGTVIFAEDVKKGYGNVVITRHQYFDNERKLKTIDAFYHPLQKIDVTVGDTVRRGDQVGTIGRGPQDMYPAHLHFEIRKNLKIGFRGSLFPRTLEHYHSPQDFIAANRPPSRLGQIMKEPDVFIKEDEPKSSNNGQKGKRSPSGGIVAEAQKSKRAEFLQTDYEALSDWLDERFDVKFRGMTPQIIFDQIPLNDIHYITVNLPDGANPFVFEGTDIPRRELLREIASHWNLKLEFKIADDGNPAALIVSGAEN